MARSGKAHKRHRSDGNQKAIVERLRDRGAVVKIIGQPVDLLIGFLGRSWLAEVKSATGKRTPAQEKFFAEWNGEPPVTLRTVDEAQALLDEMAQ